MWRQILKSREHELRSVEDGLDYVDQRGFSSTIIVTTDMRMVIVVDHPDEIVKVNGQTDDEK
jgi:hypothetical protein